ncbi:hypothetical protein [Flavobacterium sp. K5-23]|uniref:hypothetical protein n=1 Tax=Flavobacterium sp. K5-23 TaxID=2746225 RepID=UPI00200D8C07|nr:hypothetical protein [Flavobacterium sp. K5-23]UQD55947.1 hypothetical protein FLAK523_05840 [Flavobacterium sp. K5-23]
MSTTNSLSRTLGFLRNLRAKRNLKNQMVTELVHPRLGIDAVNNNNKKVQNISLLSLMYSKENDTLFI